MTLREYRGARRPATATYKRAALSEPAQQLAHAAFANDVNEVERLLMRKTAQIDRADGDGFTPLLVAVRWNRLEVVKFLLEQHSADATKCTNEGDSPFNLAQLHGHTEMADYLRTTGCSTLPNTTRQQRSADTEQWLDEALAPRRSQGGVSVSWLAAGSESDRRARASPTFSAPCSPRYDGVAMWGKPELEPEPEPEQQPEPEPEPEPAGGGELSEGVPPEAV
jgi:hypothetical protein